MRKMFVVIMTLIVTVFLFTSCIAVKESLSQSATDTSWESPSQLR